MSAGDLVIEIDPPPQSIVAPRGVSWMAILPAFGALGAVGFLFIGPRSPITYVAGGLFALSALAMVVVGVRRGRDTHGPDLTSQRLDYLSHLRQVADRAIAGIAEQRQRGADLLPPAALLTAPIMSSAPSTTARIGSVMHSPQVVLAMPRLDTHQRYDRFCFRALRRLQLDADLRIPVAAVIPLDLVRTVSIGGESGRAREVLRSIVCQLMFRHSPDELGLLVHSAVPDEWAWVKWLPHTARHAPRTVIVIDDCMPTDEAALHDVVLTSGRRERSPDLRIAVDGGAVDRDGRQVSLDDCSIAVAEAIARRLAAHWAHGGETETGRPGPMEITAVRRERGRGAQLRTVLGDGLAGSAVELDLKEPAEGGDGPHGVIIGMTGSGKSELLRTLVIGLAARNCSTQLNFVLADFKGGATFLPLARLPHVAAMITNLQSDEALIDRLRDALTGELHRRQRLLSEAGVAAVRDYAALPSLVVVIDEFSELLTQRPDFLDVLLQIGRLGRSLGVHLLLASQSLDEGRIRGLDAHLAFRIALRTLTAAESRAVIGSAGAQQLPAIPGRALLKTAAPDPIEFQTAHVSGPAPVQPVADDQPAVSEFVSRVRSRAQDVTGASVLDLRVAQLRRIDAPSAPIWLAPLGEPFALGELAVPDDPLRVPIGLVDRPREQRIDPYAVDLRGAGGHVAVVGGPRSGKSTTLCTLALSLARRLTPRELLIYGIDCSDGTISRLRGLPHVGEIVDGADSDQVSALISLLQRTVQERTQQRAAGCQRIVLLIDGWAAFRDAHDDAEIQSLLTAGLAVGLHVFVAANQWAQIRPAMRDAIRSAVELALSDPYESIAGRARAQSVPARTPGRGITAAGEHTQIALPQMQQSGDLAAAVAELRSRWPHEPNSGLPVLPASVRLSDLPANASGSGVCLAIEGTALGVVRCVDSVPFTIVLGDHGTGKTTLLSSIASQISALHEPDDAKLVILSLRSSLASQVDPQHLLAAAYDADQVRSVIDGLVDGLRQRQQERSRRLAQIRADAGAPRPVIHLLVDDYDLVAAGGALTALLPYLGLAEHLGLRVALTRRINGAARALFDPVLSAIREQPALTFVLGGHEEVLGIPPRRLPPGRGTVILPDGQRLPVQLVASG